VIAYIFIDCTAGTGGSQFEAVDLHWNIDTRINAFVMSWRLLCHGLVSIATVYGLDSSGLIHFIYFPSINPIESTVFDKSMDTEFVIIYTNTNYTINMQNNTGNKI
jgi:hypothetical protein